MGTIVETAYPDTYSVTKEYAKANRCSQTDAESVLWEILRGNRLGYKFRRQHIIGDYIADFICLRKKLIIEVDGAYHNTPKQAAEDFVRTKWLNGQGYYVLRFTNSVVFDDIDYVKNRISELLSNI